MGKPYAEDLRKRVVAAVETGGLSCNQAAKQFGLPSERPFYGYDGYENRSLAPSMIGGYMPKAISGDRRVWLLQRIKRDFTLRGLVAELAERGLKVDYCSVWEFVHVCGWLGIKIQALPGQICMTSVSRPAHLFLSISPSAIRFIDRLIPIVSSR
jgi:transposase